DLVSKDTPLFAINGGDAEINAQRGQMTYQQAQEALHPTITTSGVLNEVYVRNGDSVTPGTALAKVLASKDFYIDFMFTYSSADAIYVGQSATVFIGNFDGSVQGTVSSVSDSSALSSNGMQLRAVRVKLSNPGIVSDSFTASAAIGNSVSYGDSKVTMASAATVYASGNGTVTGFDKLVGSTVKKGEALCTVESEANRNQVRNAQLGVKSAQNAVDNYHISSPIAGTVIEKKFKAGDMVEGMNSGSLAIIFDLSYLKLTMNVDELDIGKVQVGQKVTITADALEGDSFTGRVDKISINGTTNNGVTTYPVDIVIQEYGRLLPGMNVSASIIGEELKNVLCVPVDAVSRGNVITVPGKGAMNAEGTGVVDITKLEERTVELGRNDDAYIEVLSGLDDGETVLIQNQSSNLMQQMMGG
ncbi:MAG: efflux RND transporter periplasmic adaptor subunit, partial [Oscillibacter sp.]